MSECPSDRVSGVEPSGKAFGVSVPKRSFVDCAHGGATKQASNNEPPREVKPDNVCGSRPQNRTSPLCVVSINHPRGASRYLVDLLGENVAGRFRPVRSVRVKVEFFASDVQAAGEFTSECRLARTAVSDDVDSWSVHIENLKPHELLWSRFSLGA